MALGVPQLLAMTQSELDDLFTKSPAGPIPDGPAKGTAIIAPGTVFSDEIAEVINFFAWQGKVFTPNPDGNGATLEKELRSLNSGVRYWVAVEAFNESGVSKLSRVLPIR